MSSEFVGQSAVVTGGGSGIGLECARQLGRDGAASRYLQSAVISTPHLNDVGAT